MAMFSASECRPGPHSPLSRWRNANVFLPFLFFCPFVRLMNKLRPQSIGRIDPQEDGILRTSNITKFLESCFTNGFPPEDLFLRDDLIRVTSDSLTRVANTIIALVNYDWEKMSKPGRFHNMQGAGDDKLDEKSQMHRPTPSGRPQIGPGNSDPIPIPPKRHLIHPERKRSNVQSAKNQSNSWSMRNQSIAHSMVNNFIIHRRTKQSFSPRNANVNGRHSGPRVSGAAVGNESSPVDMVGLNTHLSRLEGVVDPPIEPSGSTSTSDDSKSGKVFILGEEGKACTQFVGVSFSVLFCAMGWLIVVCFSNSEIPLDKVHVRVCTVQSTRTQGKWLR
jgi:hypothetical protein